jgi:hypothetical protein
VLVVRADARCAALRCGAGRQEALVESSSAAAADASRPVTKLDL